MEKRDRAEELIKSLQSIESLEDVPADVSLRFQETLSKLSHRDSQIRPKKNWPSSGNQFILAASITLVFALGVVFTLNSGEDQSNPSGTGQNLTSNAPLENDFTDDQLLYAGGQSSLPKISNTPIKLANTAHDYSNIPSGFQLRLGVGNTWNSTVNLELKTVKCLKTLALDNSTNLIDSGFLNGKEVQAIWTPLNSTSWSIYLINNKCEVQEKIFFKE